MCLDNIEGGSKYHYVEQVGIHLRAALYRNYRGESISSALSWQCLSMNY
jgi:hypothetical protein